MVVYRRWGFIHAYEDCPVGLSVRETGVHSITQDPRDCPWCLLRNRREVALVVVALSK